MWYTLVFRSGDQSCSLHSTLSFETWSGFRTLHLGAETGLFFRRMFKWTVHKITRSPASTSNLGSLIDTQASGPGHGQQHGALQQSEQKSAFSLALPMSEPVIALTPRTRLMLFTRVWSDPMTYPASRLSSRITELLQAPVWGQLVELLWFSRYLRLLLENLDWDLAYSSWVSGPEQHPPIAQRYNSRGESSAVLVLGRFGSITEIVWILSSFFTHLSILTPFCRWLARRISRTTTCRLNL